MSWIDSIKERFLTPARKQRFAYFRSVPLKRLSVLAVAAFCIFASIGLLSALLNDSVTYLLSGFSWAFVSGFIAVLYVGVFTRKPKLLPVLLLFQILVNLSMVRFTIWVSRNTPVVPFKTAVDTYAVAGLVLTVAGYILFLIFIQTEGRFAFRAQTELSLAHGIQQTLVPVIEATLAGCQIYGISVPSEKVGGDLVDAVSLVGGSAVVYIADIAGHGLQAGIFMGMVKTAVRTCLMHMQSPQALFASLNEVLPSVKEANMYATCAAIHLKPAAGTGCIVEYSLAGHPAILHLGAAGEICDPLADEQLPLGLLPNAQYRSKTFSAAAGDLLAAATDGILEVCDKQGLEFGAQGLAQVLLAGRSAPLPELASRVLMAVKKFGRQEDDQTLLLIRVL